MSDEGPKVILRCIRKDSLPSGLVIVTLYSDAGAATLRLSAEQAAECKEGTKYSLTVHEHRL